MGVEKRGILCACDIDTLPSGHSVCHCLFIRSQSDNEFGQGEQSACEQVEASAKIKFVLAEQVSAEKEAGEAVEVQIEPAVHQSDTRSVAQSLFLFCTQEQVVHLVGECEVRVLFSQCLKWTFGMLFESGLEPACFGKCLNERSLAHTAWTNDRNEFVHGILRIV